MIFRLIGRLLCAGVLLSVTAGAAPAGTSGSCKPTSVKFYSSDPTGNKSMSTNTFVNIPQAAVSFKQGGSSASCVIVRFSAETLAVVNETMRVRAVLDNVVNLPPQGISYAAPDTIIAHAFDFIFPSVAPGNHVLRMQFQSNSGLGVFIGAHSLVVQFVP